MNEMDKLTIQGSNFGFSATSLENLGSTEYTLATIVVDTSLSVRPYKEDLLKMEKAIIESCKKSPRSQNLLVRLLHFNSEGNITEVHGFKLLDEIDTNSYKPLSCSGATALVDAVFSGIGATLTFAKTLIDQDYDVNGCVYIITDGEENDSTLTMNSIKQKLLESQKKEVIESLTTILIGLTNDNQINSYLQQFKDDCGLDQFIGVGEATPENLAKLTGFISSSISSVSQSLNTGSKSIPLTIN